MYAPNLKPSLARVMDSRAPMPSGPKHELFAFFDKYLKPAASQRRILISDHGPKDEIVAMEWPSGHELWTKPNERGHDVQSLPDGHVLYTIGPKKTVVEIDGEHEPVWSYSEGLEHPLAAQRLPNGNTLIGDAKLGRVIEVTPDKKVVWKYESRRHREHADA